ncbi:cytochrome c oxidase assembly factor Coa1 family protein [Marinicellulosiphila megalodicopiae]|uniref:cytochrome c oxidase assembly factor Coa1 family protein n=1 Tax=Marinicellulosiphila megalodicopiae TaxID=2724896 RepID=UPI003BB0DF0B
MTTQQDKSRFDQWNWGAFCFNWIWGLSNNTYSAFKIFIPFYGIYYMFMLGKHGNKWAWENKKWENENAFFKSQRKWNIASLFIIPIILIFITLIFFIILLLFKKSAPYLLSLQLLEASPEFKDNIGNSFSTGMVLGSIQYNNLKGDADLYYTATSEKGYVNVNVVATKSKQWKIVCLKAEYNDSIIKYYGNCKK